MSTPPPDLAAVVESACAAGVSTSRERQLRWVAGELAAYAATLPGRNRPRTRGGWLSPAFVTGYLSVADAGMLRRRGNTGRPSSDATRRVRRACVRLLAAAAGLVDPVPDEVPPPQLHDRAEKVPVAIALAHWSGRAAPVTAKAADVRAAAMAALTHEAGLRSGELAALEVGSLDLAAGTLTYQPRPPAARDLPPPVTVTLSASTLGLLRHWLTLRAQLTELTPRTRTLWVSLAANHDGSGVRRPPGLPLRPRGVVRAHARAVASANFELAGQPGYAPLPRTPGALRPEPAPAVAGDDEARPPKSVVRR